MKTNVSFIVGIILTAHCLAQGQNFTVVSDKKSDVDFEDYKTYYWASQIESETDQGNFLNDQVLKDDIQEAVKAELDERGYKFDPAAPDLIVNFRVYNEAATLQSYSRSEQSHWSDTPSENSNGQTTYNVDPGTLFISFVDRKKGDIIWQGFASGLLNNNAFIKDESKIKEAVDLIFEEYGFRATEYSKR